MYKMGNNELNSNFTYTGKVTLKIQDLKSKKIISQREIKNSGTINLFHFLCNCLTGNYETSKRPRYLDASSNKINSSTPNNQNNFSSTLYYRSIISSANVKLGSSNIETAENAINTEYSNYHALFSATILKGQINNTYNEGKIKSFALCNSPDITDNTSGIMAWINLDIDNADGINDEVSLENNQALLVEWDLSFDNYIAARLF